MLRREIDHGIKRFAKAFDRLAWDTEHQIDTDIIKSAASGGFISGEKLRKAVRSAKQPQFPLVSTLQADAEAVYT